MPATTRPADSTATRRTVRGGRARDALGIAISLVSIAAVAWWASRQERPSFPTAPEDLALVGAAIVLYGGITALRGWRWHVVLTRAGVDHVRGDAYGLTVIGYMGNTVLPARGGELLRVFILGERSRSRRREILGSILAERLLDIAALVFLFVAMTWLHVAGSPTGTAPAAAAVALVAVAVLGVAILVRLRRSGRLARFADVIRPFAHASRLLVGRLGLALVVLTAAVWLLEGINFWLIAQTLDVRINLVEAAFLVVIATFFAIVPAGPAYAGTFDAALIFGLTALDVTGGQAVAYVLLVRFVLFVPITLAGAILLVARYGGFSRLRAWRSAST